MLMPKKVKYRKQQRGKNRGVALRGSSISFGEYGLQATERGWITARQIEAARIAMTRHVKRGGKIWIRIFPDKPVTEKPAETRMGSGKGNPEYWVAVIKPGRVMFELAGVDEDRELLGERRLAGIGVRDDREGAPPRGLGRQVGAIGLKRVGHGRAYKLRGRGPQRASGTSRNRGFGLRATRVTFGT